MKYEMASVRSFSFRMENSSPSSSVYISEYGAADSEKHSSTYRRVSEVSLMYRDLLYSVKTQADM